VINPLYPVCRRIGRSYLRQLWDDDYAALAAEDAEKEIFFRAVSEVCASCLSKEERGVAGQAVLFHKYAHTHYWCQGPICTL
jgi:hypothetical protein